MASKRGSYFDFLPSETDEEVIRLEEEKMLGKKRGKKIGVDVLLNQKHTAKDGKKLVSHLLCVPKGQQPHWAIKRFFIDNPMSGKEDRANWNPISDVALRRKMEGYDIYWLCPAHMYDADWVDGVVNAFYKGCEGEDVEITDRRPVVEF